MIERVLSVRPWNAWDMDPGDVNAQPGPASSPDDVGAVWESPIDGFVAIEGSVRHLMADASWNGVAWRVELTRGGIKSMKIQGILVTDMLVAYKEKHAD